ncbi:unnamed protein product, partial [Thelazia callipaeda]|uniref:Peptidase A1 domain-containing protein n=1 Tax=Thelazia callipaeda TaxID=103827 RepID=A0A0N5CTU1_THECL
MFYLILSQHYCGFQDRNAGSHDFCDGKAEYSHLLSRTCRTVIPHRRYSVYSHKRKVIAYEYDDDITINQVNDQPLKIINAAFGTPSVLRWTDATKYRLVDGVLGLSSLNINDFLHDNPIHKVLRSPSTDPIITIALPPRSSYMTPTLTLGASDDELCSTSDKQVTEKLVSTTNRYDFAYSSISIGNTTFSLQWSSAFAYIHTIKPYIAV